MCLNLYVLYKKDNEKLNRLIFLLKYIEQFVEEYVLQQPQTSKVG